MESGQRGGELKKDVDTVGPEEGQATPGVVQKPGGPRSEARSMVTRREEARGFDNATLIPSHGSQGAVLPLPSWLTSMREKALKIVQLEHDRIPEASGSNKSASS